MALSKITAPTASGPGWAALQKLGIVYVRLTGYSGGGTLPVGFRPASTETFPFHNASPHARVDIRTDGTMTISGVEAGTAYLSLNFMAA